MTLPSPADDRAQGSREPIRIRILGAVLDEFEAATAVTHVANGRYDARVAPG
jgi:hypothetical protein